MKLCKDCKHCGDVDGRRYEKCEAPQNLKTARVDPVSGERTRQEFVYCDSHRNGSLTGWVNCRITGLCGKGGRWFEPKD